jgi:dihydropteroate synthase
METTVRWKHRRGWLRIEGRPLIMGILNTTPDSFSDGGRYANPEQAVAHGLAMAAQGADIVDVGGESTRPGSAEIGVQEEMDRVVPVIRALRENSDVPVSVDTSKALVARQALAAGADIVNDVSACRRDTAMAETVVAAGAGLVLMHMQGTPRTMQNAPAYGDVVREVTAWLVARADALLAQGLPRENLMLDPGIGFGKTMEHNLQLLARLDELVATGWPVLVGASRKRFIGALTGRAADDRLAGSLAVAVCCAQRGAAALRVHDVCETKDAVLLATALERIENGLE